MPVLTLQVESSASLLARLRRHPGCANIVECMKLDCDAWAASELAGDEDYPGEARERREAYEMAIELLGGE